MAGLIIPKAVDTPEIQFDPDAGKFRIEGESYPENAMEFYRPVIESLNTFVANHDLELEVNFKMMYFNSSSSKCLLDIFDILEEFSGRGNQVIVNWYFQEDDEDIRESGEDFAEDLDLEFNLIPYT